MADNRPLSGKVAVVTGASSGIGAAIVRQLSAAGAKVAMAARRVELLEQLKQELVAEGGAVICVRTDVVRKEEVKKLMEHVTYSLGPIDILVNNAGVLYYQTMQKAHIDTWDQQVDVNCKGVMYCVGEVLPGMVERQSGHIVNMSSDAGRRGFAGLAVYSGTKFFVEGMSQALRHEVAGKGVRITCIQPGDVQTEIGAKVVDPEAVVEYDGSSKIQVMDPEDIGRAVLYALSQPPHVAVNEVLIQPREAPI